GHERGRDAGPPRPRRPRLAPLPPGRPRGALAAAARALRGVLRPAGRSSRVAGRSPRTFAGRGEGATGRPQVPDRSRPPPPRFAATGPLSPPHGRHPTGLRPCERGPPRPPARPHLDSPPPPRDPG